MKLRIKTFKNRKASRRFVLQKRVLFLFWSDVSAWFINYDNVKSELAKLRGYGFDGVKL
jgi:hypothetical protein